MLGLNLIHFSKRCPRQFIRRSLSKRVLNGQQTDRCNHLLSLTLLNEMKVRISRLRQVNLSIAMTLQLALWRLKLQRTTCSTVCSDAHQRKHQISVSLTFACVYVRGAGSIGDSGIPLTKASKNEIVSISWGHLPNASLVHVYGTRTWSWL